MTQVISKPSKALEQKTLEQIVEHHGALVLIKEVFPDDSAHLVIRWKHPKDGTVLDAPLLKNRELWCYGEFKSVSLDVVVKFTIETRNRVHATLEGLS